MSSLGRHVGSATTQTVGYPRPPTIRTCMPGVTSRNRRQQP